MGILRRTLLAATAAVAIVAPAHPANATGLVEPFVIALLTAAGISASATVIGSLTVGALVTGIATLALGVGIAYLLAPKPPKPENSRTPFTQNIPPVIYGYGRARVAGATVLKEAVEGVLYVVNALTGHEIIGIVGYYLNDDLVELNPDGTISTVGDGRYGRGSMKLFTRTGEPLETAYAGLVDAIPDVWTENHRGDGVASLYMMVKTVKSKVFSKIFPYGPPQPSVAADLCRVFDPRDEDQSWDDPSTWTTSGYTNPILCLLHFECFSPFGAMRNYEVAILPVLAEWIEEADICDEEVAVKAGGTEPRYRMGGWTTTEQTDVRGTRQQILTTCDGFFVERGDGTIRVWAGKYRAPTVTITDDDIVGYSWDSDKPDSDRFEFMTAKYCSPANGYSSVDTDPVQLDNGASSENKHRTASSEMVWVQSTGQASRLLRREVSRYHETLRGEITMRLSGVNAIYERWVYVNSSIPRLDGAVIENKGPSISISEGITRIKFMSSGPHVDTYSAAADESSPPMTVARPEDKLQPVPVIVSSSAETITMETGEIVVYIAVVIERPTYESGDYRDDLTFSLRWALDDAEPVWSYKSVNPTPDALDTTIEMQTDPVQQGTTYLVEVASVSASGNESAWSVTETVSTTVAGTAPASPAITSATGLVGAASITVMSPNSPNVAAVRVWRNLTGDPFASATDASGALYCGPNQSVAFVDSPVAIGAWDYWATAENSAGTPSTPTGPATVTVT